MDLMSKAIENLEAALQRGIAGRPNVAGFPYLAETLRRAGVTRNIWFLPACQSFYLTGLGPVVMQGGALVSSPADVPAFDREALIKALRNNQAGNSTFPEFLAASWRAGVGVAVGNAVRTSLIVVVSVTLLLSLAVYGSNGNFNLSG